jgi:hypothetical protein
MDSGADLAQLSSEFLDFLRKFDPSDDQSEWSVILAPPSRSPSSTAEVSLPFAIDQLALSDGARYILISAAQRAPGFQATVSTTLVLIEMIERGRVQGGAYWSADFLRQAVDPYIAKYTEMRDSYLKRYDRDEPGESAAHLVTPGLAYVLARAQDLAEATTGDRNVSARHILATIIADPPNPHRLGSTKRLMELGIELPLLRQHLFEWLRAYGDNDEAWRLFLLGADTAPHRLTEFDADDTRGPDLLDIEQDARALATLIAARSLSPPLSIGLFGDWGTGKTFFMRQLQRTVAKLSKDARDSVKPQREVPFFKHVVQIEFNAWHYVEGNLWASLVEHIFRNLRQSDISTRESIEEMQRHWIEQLGFKETALVEATERVSEAASRVVSADQRVATLKLEYDRKTSELQRLSAHSIARDFTLAGVPSIVREALQPLGLHPVGAAVTELQSSLRQARSILERGNSVITPLIRATDRRNRWRSLVLILVGGPLAGLLVGTLLTALGKTAIGQISSVATALATLLTFGARWIRTQATWMSDRLDQLERANRSYDEALAKEQAGMAEAITSKEQELALERQDYAMAQQTADQARREHDTVKQELANTTPGRLLDKFIEDRAASSDYRKHLGVLAVTRDDFQQLSKLMEAENERLTNLPTASEEVPNADKRINRIVLYIDDLDRCPPDKVIDVLQAVHLLLAFPLFVVVVGVDARWISRSLEARYRELLRVDGSDPAASINEMFGAARSDDYLEKIFQIPLWLRPLGASGARRMIQGLLRPTRITSQPRSRQQSATMSAPSTQSGMAADVKPQQGLSERNAPTTSEPFAESKDARTLILDETRHQPGDENLARLSANVESLEIRDFEIDTMEDLSPLLGRSPRALKRFINVYRLIKAGLTEAELGLFVRRRDDSFSPYETVLFLFAVDTGLPRISRTVFDILRREAVERAVSSRQDEKQSNGMNYDLISALESSLTTTPEGPGLKAWLMENQRSAKLVNVLPQLTMWLDRVSRYSFQAAQVE